MKYLKLSLLILHCFFSFLTIAQQPSKLSLQDVIQQSIQHNYNIQIETINLKLLNNTSTISEAGLLPKLDASYTYKSGSEDTEYDLSSGSIITGSNAASTYGNADLTLSQTLTNIILPFHTYKKIKQTYDLNDLELQLLIETTLLETILTYYDILKTNESVHLFNQMVANSEANYIRIKSLQELGSATTLDMLEAESNLKNDQASLSHEKNQLIQQKQHLNYLMGVPLTQEVDLENVLILKETLHLNTLEESTLDQNLGIKIAKQTFEISNTDIQLIIDSLYPSLTLSIAYDNSNSTAESGYITKSEVNGFESSLYLSWSLFDGKKRFNQLKNLTPTKERNQLILENTKSTVKKELLKHYTNYKHQLQLISLTETMVSTNEQLLNHANSLYELGQLDLKDLRDFQVTLLQTKLRQNHALFEARKNECRLFQISGQLSEQLIVYP